MNQFSTLSTLLLGAVFAFSASAAQAEKKPVDKKAAHKAAAEYDTNGASRTELHCAMGEQVALYQQAGKDDEIGLSWKKKLVKLERVATTTGAQRFESKQAGLVWIGIPDKGMLLDSKKGQQLVNECRSAEQTARAKEPRVAESMLDSK